MSELITSLFIFFLGTIAGSFLTSVTYRIPKNISFIRGRSYCPKCKKTISWYDNIPLLSYFILNGKCRHCGKKISGRYPVIEFFTGLTFLSLWYFLSVCGKFSGSSLFVCGFEKDLGLLAFPFLLILAVFLISLFIIDFENQVLPDELTMFVFVYGLLYLVLVKPDSLYVNFLTGLLASLFFLALNLITKGRGMGLGDVKLVLAGGLVLGKIVTLDWILLSFILGGVVSSFLLFGKRVKMKDRIAFGPILIVSFLVEVIFGPVIFSLLNL